MSMKTILNKMFGSAKESFDEYGQPIRKETMEEKQLQKHLDIEHRRKVKATLDFYRKKHWKEMTSHEMPYHKKFRQLNRIKKRKRR